jgi:exopolysaccharide biosynthesis predicted pyruvyltransferase EpsI
MNDHYLVLTGAYNNVGDYLIAARICALLRKYRPDRAVIEQPRREISSSEFKDTAATARAILIAGGPAFRANLVPAS